MESVEIINKLEEFYLNFGIPVVFFGSLMEATPLAWIFPGGVMVAIGGFYSYSGHLSLVAVIVAAFLGELLSFVLTYLAGYKRLGLIRLFHQEKNAKKIGLVMKKHGALIMTTSMLAGLTRFLVSYIAGQQKYSFKKFLMYATVASFTWTTIMAVIGYLAGSERELFEKALKGLGVFGWLLLVIALGVFIFHARKEFRELTGEEELEGINGE